MKKLLKDKRLLAIIGGAAILVLFLTLVYLLTQGDKTPPIDSTSEPSTSTSDSKIIVELPDKSETPDVSEDSMESDIDDDGTGLKPDEKIPVDSKTTTGEKAQDTAPAVKETNPPKNTDNQNGGGIQIGDGDNQQKYSCGSPNHHCHNEDAHAWILNLELEGCSYCGSHSCPSFYAVNEWGDARYTPSKCPKYDTKKDAVEYCQVCGKKNGNGDNDTCQKWIIDFTCPTCGELVKANKCHTH
ncbi:MAG: hypothetical protein PHV32_16455 [Eubacteriales bacterium]|nr:hypothetical protein [Oscillospiraceae bacterium]MDD4495903.1 hypothetical protein [Eubacteriales bacterium]